MWHPEFQGESHRDATPLTDLFPQGGAKELTPLPLVNLQNTFLFAQRTTSKG